MKLSDPTTEVLQAMDAAEPRNAANAVGLRLQSLKNQGSDGMDLPLLWAAFRRLLHRRGYYSHTPEALAVSLAEIDQVGEGFDLYDLARSLAEYDALRAEGLGRPGHRALSELQRFNPRNVKG